MHTKRIMTIVLAALLVALALASCGKDKETTAPAAAATPIPAPAAGAAENSAVAPGHTCGKLAHSHAHTRDFGADRCIDGRHRLGLRPHTRNA